ncbi:Ig-like domain-containing protein, partial [Pseudomonas pseudonitroreducens]
DVVVTFPTGEVATTTADENGDWSVTPTQPLPEGNNDITVVATDPAGNESEPTVISVIIDTTAPVAPDAWLDPDSDTGVKGDDITSDTTPTIDGKTEPGADVVVTFPTGEEVHTKADDNGDWSVTPTQPLPEGNNDISVVAIDPAGNQSEPTVISVEIDTTAPDAPDAWLDPASDSGVPGDNITNDTKPTIDGKTEPGADVVVTFPTGEEIHTKADDNGDWSVTPTQPLPEGDNDITVVAIDPAGNQSEPTVITVEIDTIAPDADTLAITGVLDDVGLVTGNIEKGGTTDDSHPTISGTGTAGDTIVVFTKDVTGENHPIGSTTVAADGSWSVKPELPLAAGLNELTAVETDVAGNSTTSQPYDIILDMGAPSAPTIEGVYDDVGPYQGFLQKGDVTDDNQPTVNGSAQPGCVVKLYDENNKLIGSTTADADGKWSITPEVPLADGEHAVHATATNPVGVVSEPTGPWNFVVDTIAPDNTTLVVTDHVGDVTGPLHNGDTTDDNKPTFSGDAEPNGKVIIYDNGTPIGSAAVDPDGKWEFTPTKPLNDGPHE